MSDWALPVRHVFLKILKIVPLPWGRKRRRNEENERHYPDKQNVD
jgi:hypothetical protein